MLIFMTKGGGGIEADFKEDKHGLGLSSRNKKRYEGQAMLQLAALAHNVLIWARGWLGESQPKLMEYELKRWVRDLLTSSGRKLEITDPQTTLQTFATARLASLIFRIPSFIETIHPGSSLQLKLTSFHS